MAAALVPRRHWVGRGLREVPIHACSRNRIADRGCFLDGTHGSPRVRREMCFRRHFPGEECSRDGGLTPTRWWKRKLICDDPLETDPQPLKRRAIYSANQVGHVVTPLTVGEKRSSIGG
jgi:hypothetical protein